MTDRPHQPASGADEMPETKIIEVEYCVYCCPVCSYDALWDRERWDELKDVRADLAAHPTPRSSATMTDSEREAVTKEGYKVDAVEKILKAKDSPPVGVFDREEFGAWLDAPQPDKPVADVDVEAVHELIHSANHLIKGLLDVIEAKPIRDLAERQGRYDANVRDLLAIPSGKGDAEPVRVEPTKCPTNAAFKLEALVSARQSAKREQTTLNESAKARASEIAAERADAELVAHPPSPFWVIEIMDGLTATGRYWDGSDALSFESDVEKSIQFNRQQDALWAIRLFGWKNVKVSVRPLYATPPAPEPRVVDVDTGLPTHRITQAMSRLTPEIQVVLYKLEQGMTINGAIFTADECLLISDEIAEFHNAMVDSALIPEPQAQGVPDGFVLVPVEPTKEMMHAGIYQSARGSSWDDVYSMWKDMLAARPVTQELALPQDVINLVIAARNVAYDTPPDDEVIRELDKACEAFAERVPWEDEPDDEECQRETQTEAGE